MTGSRDDWHNGRTMKKSLRQRRNLSRPPSQSTKRCSYIRKEVITMQRIYLTQAEAERFAQITESGARTYRDTYHTTLCRVNGACSCEEFIREMMDSAQDLR